MELFYGKYQEINNQLPLAIAIGNFDGVHLGHQALIEKLLTFDESFQKGVMTFNPHTMQLFTNGQFQTIGTAKDKVFELQKYPLDKIYLIDFNWEFARLEIHEMIDFLKGINVKKIVIGNDFRFGNKGLGRPSDLSNHFDVYVVDDVIYENKRVSSTIIKDLISNGNLDFVKTLLNHPYQFSAEVIYGNQVGTKELGFPTANLDYDNLLLPPNGVYMTKIYYDDRMFYGMTNIGYNPTVNYSESKKLEVHILGFNEMIYGEEIKIEFIKWIRHEKKFKSKAELINQLEKDKNHIIKLSKAY